MLKQLIISNMENSAANFPRNRSQAIKPGGKQEVNAYATDSFLKVVQKKRLILGRRITKIFISRSDENISYISLNQHGLEPVETHMADPALAKDYRGQPKDLTLRQLFYTAVCLKQSVLAVTNEEQSIPTLM